MLTSLKHLFSLPDDFHYLNCAYMSPISKRVEEAGILGMQAKRVPSLIEPADFFDDCNDIRALFGRLVNADPERIAVIPSASYGLAIAARNTRLEGGQNIVIAADQFPSNVYSWLRKARESGAELRVVSARDGGRRHEGWNSRFLEAIDDATAVVALGQVHWTDGTLFNLKEIGARARETGAAFIIDGTQSVGALPFDIEDIAPDALICAGYKWLMGPYGISVAYYGERYDDGTPLEETWIGRLGSEDFRRLVDYQDCYRPGAVRYDAGESSNFIHVPMLKAALEQILDWGVDEIQSYCQRLNAPLEAEAKERGWPLEDAAGRGAHVLGIPLPASLEIPRLKLELEARNVAVSLRGDSIRVSPHVYNDTSDIDALLAALRESL